MATKGVTNHDSIKFVTCARAAKETNGSAAHAAAPIPINRRAMFVASHPDSARAIEDRTPTMASVRRQSDVSPSCDRPARK